MICGSEGHDVLESNEYFVRHGKVLRYRNVYDKGNGLYIKKTKDGPFNEEYGIYSGRDSSGKTKELRG